MRAAALDIARRVPATAPGRAELIRRIARDAIMANPAAPLEFYAFEALGAASDPGIDADAAADGVAMIASEAAGVAALREQSEPWRSSADFLLSQRLPRAAAEFLRARLEDPAGLSDADVTLLMRAAIATASNDHRLGANEAPRRSSRCTSAASSRTCSTRSRPAS